MSLRPTAASTALLAFALMMSGCKHHTSAVKPADGTASHVRQDQADAAAKQAALLNMAATEMDTSVPADAQRAISVFKAALATLTDDVLAGQPAGASAAQVQQALQAVLPASKAPDDAAAQAAAKAAGKNEFDIPEKGDYGGEVTSSVTELQPGLLLADVGFGIQCGDDHMLLGYSNASGRWRRVLRWQAAPYAEVSGAFGDMFIPLKLNQQRNGHTVLLVVHGTPWCTSTESHFAMDTLEVDPNGSTEKPFWHADKDYRRADELFKLKPTSDGFEVRTSVDDRVGDAVSRVGIMRYTVGNGTVQRTLPIARNSRESVSEWLSMPRDEARLFTDAPEGSSAWAMWQTFTYEGKSTDAAVAAPSPEYGDVRACSAPERYQVQIKSQVSAGSDKGQTPGPSYYVQVHETGNGYRIVGTRTEPDPACAGRLIALKPSGATAADEQ